MHQTIPNFSTIMHGWVTAIHLFGSTNISEALTGTFSQSSVVRTVSHFWTVAYPGFQSWGAHRWRPMRSGDFGEGQRSGPPPRQLGGLRENCHYPHPHPKKKSPRICTNRVTMPVDGRGCTCPPPCAPRPSGYATVSEEHRPIIGA